MEAIVAILMGLGMLIALRPRPGPRRALLPAEAEASHRRGAPERLEARIAHVEALTTTLASAPGAGLAALEAVLVDEAASYRARGALLWLRLKSLDVDEAAFVLQALLTNPSLRAPTLRAAIELAADGNPSSSRRLLEILEEDAGLAAVARPLSWALLVAGPYDVECRAIGLLGQSGDAEDAKDLLRHFGAEPELYDRVRAAVSHIHERSGAHALSIVDDDELGGQGRLSLGPDRPT